MVIHVVELEYHIKLVCVFSCILLGQFGGDAGSLADRHDVVFG